MNTIYPVDGPDSEALLPVLEEGSVPLTTPTPEYRPTLAAVLHNSLEEFPGGQDALPFTLPIPSADAEVALATVSGGGSASASSGEESAEEESAEMPAISPSTAAVVEEEEAQEVFPGESPTSGGSGEREAYTTKPEDHVTQGKTDVALIYSN